ncbi:histidinol phosphate phosphatase [Clostridium rectalis]|uniref:histidinol phosphate phosphatase n=1 Tax=Clostridium rectalis TaxID=2040295 RepID=UPI000F639A4E|nr:histidinol phosphate phosphatase [Clostridium rectalis]
MFDSHIHTKFSTDSKMDIKQVLDVSEKNDIGIVITEHLDLNFMRPGEFIFNIDKYFKEYSKYRNSKLLLGIEMGMRPDCIEENRKISKEYPFDFVLGSVHVVKMNNIYYDIYNKELYYNGSKTDIFIYYFNYIFRCIKEHNYIDSLAHIDYIARYAKFHDKEIYYEEYREYIDPTLKLLADSGKAIEINTRRFTQKKVLENMIKIFKRFKELGGKFVTIGSDAHINKNIGNYYKEAKEIADQCNLNIVYFKNRKVQYLK